jgi:hypothetical protein
VVSYAPSFSTSPNNNKVVSSVKNESTKPLPYVASRVDDFINNNAKLQSPREHTVSSSSSENDDNYDYEPYTRRDFRTDEKPSDKVSNDTSSGYYTPSKEHEKSTSSMKALNVSSPDSDFEYQTEITKTREENSSSPADSQSGRSVSSHRKSVSFDLDVEEFRLEYSVDSDNSERLKIQKQIDDENVFSEKSRYYHHQLQPEPKRIKGILRSPSPSVYYKGNVSNVVDVGKEFIEDDDDETGKENPFRKEYLSQEKLRPLEDEPVTQSCSSYSDNDRADTRYQSSQRQSLEDLHKSSQSRIPIKKPIFKSTGSLVDRPKMPPPRPPQPNIKVAEMVRNEGLKRMSQHMEKQDFLEFVHNAETNTIEEVKGQDFFDPDDPLPPLPKCPPPLAQYKRSNSSERPKVGPPPPPPKSPKPAGNIVEVLPARYDTLPVKQKPHFLNENSQNNILVTEDEHREILLTENELRNALLTEYEETFLSSINKEMLIEPFSSTNPFLDDSSSFDSLSLQSTPNMLSPVSTLDKSGSSFGQYIPAFQSVQHVEPINILPPPAQVLPVHYGQLPKPQHTGYPPSITHQYPIHYNAAPTGIIAQASQNPNFVHQQQNPSESFYGTEQHQQHLPQQNYQQGAYLVSGDGSNSFYVTHTVNNTGNNQQRQQQQRHQTLLMQSAYGPLSQPSPPNQASLQQLQIASHSQYVASTQANNNQPQFIYEPHQQRQQQLHHQTQFYPNSLVNNNFQFVQQPNYVESVPELSPIIINQIPNNFVYSASDSAESKSLTSFGKQTEV